MKRVYFATGNSGKYEVLKESLVLHNINLIHEPFDFFEELNSTNLSEIAIDKVLRAYNEIKKPVIALDAGFYIHSLDDFPGPKVNPVLRDPGIEGILKLIQGNDRSCKFKQCLAYMGPERAIPKVILSSVPGHLSKQPRGTMKGKKEAWSDLWLIFIPEGESKTLAEMTEEEYGLWRVKRKPDSIGSKFGEWYSKRNL